MFTTASNILSSSGLSVQQADSLLAGKGAMNGLGRAFLNVEQTLGINALFGIAQAALETGWGTSAIATQKNNLFGITAYDSDPFGNASSYGTTEDCVQYWGSFLKTQYLTPGGAYFVSTTPAGVARHWATDPNYAAKVVNIMNMLESEIPASLPVAPVVEPVALTTTRTYTVVPGDNLSTIAQKEGYTLSQLESLNPQLGHPAGNFNDIWPGDVIVLPALPQPQPAYQTQPVYVTVPPAPAGDLSNLAAKYGSSVQQIVDWNKAKYPTISPNFVEVGWYIRVA